MSLLTQCPRCGFAYIRPRNEATETITCRRCHCVFSAVAGQSTPTPPLAASLPLTAPIVVSSVPPPPMPALPMPTEFVIEEEPIHEVDHIEVLDAPPDQPPPRPQPAGPLPGIFELGPSETPALRLDDVEVVEPPPRAPLPPPIVAEPADDAIVLRPEPEPQPAEQIAVPLDNVEVLEEPEAAMLNPVVRKAPAVVVASNPLAEPTERPPPVPPRRKERPLDIRKRVPDNKSGVPWGVWLGLGIPLLAIVLLVVIILVVLRSGRHTPNLQAQPAPQEAVPPAAPAADQFLPRREDWPTHPDRRGPAPWLPKPSPLKPRAADQLQGVVGYWPLDEGKDSQVADASDNGHKSTLVGGWWIDGVRGKALLFDGRRDYLELGNSPALNFGDNVPFTVAGWMATQQQNGYLLAFRNPKNFAPVVQVKVSGGALCGVVRADGSEFGESRVGLAPVADGGWHHFAVMRHPGGMIECFLDGRSLDNRQGANTIGPITTSARTVGCERSWFLSQQTPAAYFACAVDELCVFDRALTAQEVGQLAGK